MKSYVDDDGRWHHRLSQSWLKTADTCLERARMEHTGEMPRIESDAACVGTAMHLAAETCIQSGGLTLADCIEVAQDEFSRLMQLDGTNGDAEATYEEGVFKFVKYDEPKARKLVSLFTTYWWTDVYPTLNPDAVTEWKFVVPLVDDDERVIELSGTADYVDGDEIKDWKTSGGGEYKPWEYRRWGMQPTVYTYALSEGRGDLNAPRARFEFVVMHAKGVQRFEVKRGPADWAWLKVKATDMARMIELEIPTWPKNDNHALCSPLWCPAWSKCKGALLGANPYDQSLPN